MSVPDDDADAWCAEYRARITKLETALQEICIKARSNEWGPDTPRKVILNWMHDTAAEALKEQEPPAAATPRE